jgi:hypothetical protein
MRPLLLAWARWRSQPCAAIILGTRINAEFQADMSKLFRVHQAAVDHHRPQRRQTPLGGEQPWRVSFGIKPHEATRDQPLRRRRQLELAGVGTTAPDLAVKALGQGWQL